jgi:hypothetical protein
LRDDYNASFKIIFSAVEKKLFLRQRCWPKRGLCPALNGVIGICRLIKDLKRGTS